MSGRYEVIRYPLYYVVIDHREDRKIVFETKIRTTAHRKAKKLNAENVQRAIGLSTSGGSY